MCDEYGNPSSRQFIGGELSILQERLNRMVKEGKLAQKGTPEDRAKHQQEVMDSMKAARLRANAVILREEE